MSHQPNVLVVDDDVNILSAFGEFLSKEHCNVIVSSSAEDALRKLELHQVQLVVTDVRLKGQSGATLLIRIKQLHPSLPVIVITGHPNLITEMDIKHYGADYYFQKPLELDLLRDAVRKCLHLSQTSSGRIN
jgi:DNA-binding NtrC family response regulator